MATLNTDAERIVVAPPDLAAEAEIEAAELRDIGLTVNVVIHPYALPGNVIVIDATEIERSFKRVTEAPWRVSDPTEKARVIV